MKKLFAFLLTAFLAVPTFAQDKESQELSALAVKTQALAQFYEIGVGAGFFGVDDQIGEPFFAAMLHGIDLGNVIPNIPQEVDPTLGLMIEIGKRSFAAGVSDWRVTIWTTEEARVGNVIGGAHVQLLNCDASPADESAVRAGAPADSLAVSCGFSGDIGRMVTGYTFNQNFAVRAYFLQPGEPASAWISYRF